jgi:hypothetical protein
MGSAVPLRMRIIWLLATDADLRAARDLNCWPYT